MDFLANLRCSKLNLWPWRMQLQVAKFVSLVGLVPDSMGNLYSRIPRGPVSAPAQSGCY